MDRDPPPSSWRCCVAVAFWLTALALAARLALTLDPMGWVLLAIGAPVAWAAADITTGLAHWAFDNLGSADTPVLGPVIHEFRYHHVEPKDICRSNVLETSSTAAVPGLPLLGLMHLGGMGDWWPAPLTGAFLIYVVGGVSTNYFHLLAHAEKPPAWALRLQRWRLILDREEHERHHRGEHREAYCITVGWMNAPLERMRFFERLEALFKPARGSRPTDRARP